MTGAIITRTGEILYSSLNSIGEREAADIPVKGTALPTEFDVLDTEPTPTAGLPVVGLSADRNTWMEKLGVSAIGFTDPFDHIQNINEEDVTVAEWFKDAHIARFDTSFLDFGEPSTRKDYLEATITLERNSAAYMALYAETDDSRRNYRWKGSVWGKETVRVPLRLTGNRIRLRLACVMFATGRMLIRDIRIGFNPAGVT